MIEAVSQGNLENKIQQERDSSLGTVEDFIIDS